MRQDHFEYVPQFKLIIAGNHRPQLSGHGEAMRRRLHLVPFEVTISPEKRDPQLMSKLKSERDGILGWMVEGCAEWQRLERPLPGLPAPGAVLSPSHITLENNAKICPRPDRENAFARAGGGQEGIRTLETVTRLRTFQARAFDHSATCPRRCLEESAGGMQG